MVWLLDLRASYNPYDGWTNGLPLVSGPLAAAALLFPPAGRVPHGPS
ncbi:hypothetical protein [Streptomyces mirabilis]